MADQPAGFDTTNLEGLAKIKAEQQSLRDLAQRAAEHREQVTEVYNRVVRDYEARIRLLDEQAQGLRAALREEFAKLEAQYGQARHALEQARFDLQESEFRKEIGEYSAEEFQRRQRAAEADIAEKQRDLERIGELRVRFLDLLPADAPVAPAAAVTPVASPSPVGAAPSPVVTVAPVTPLPASPVVPLPAPQPIVASAPAPVVVPAARPAAAAVPEAAASAAAPVVVPAIPTAPAAPPAAGIGETMVFAPPGSAVFRMPPAPAPAAGIGETMVLPPPGSAVFRMPPVAAPGAADEGGATRILTPPALDRGGDATPEAFATVALPAGALIEEKSGAAPITHRLGALTTIGRTPDNQIVVPSREVSRKHAEVILGQAGYTLRDLGSPNGTFVNGKKVTEHSLKEGDRITVAGITFVFKR